MKVFKSLPLFGPGDLSGIRQTFFHVSFNDGHSDLFGGGRHGGDLRQNLRAGNPFFDHALQPSQLAFDPPQPQQNLFFMVILAHTIPPYSMLKSPPFFVKGNILPAKVLAAGVNPLAEKNGGRAVNIREGRTQSLFSNAFRQDSITGITKSSASLMMASKTMG